MCLNLEPLLGLGMRGWYTRNFHLSDKEGVCGVNYDCYEVVQKKM